jgi:hypothetical protein
MEGDDEGWEIRRGDEGQEGDQEEMGERGDGMVRKGLG